MNEKMEPKNVIAHIESIRGMINSMGANDYENDALSKIIENWKNKKINDDEAIQAAEQIKDNKQDYH